ncbi:MAG: manganese efflux pump MntP family protein [Roseburia sp.]
MNWIENLLILAGISLDIFAAMECQGSLVAKVDKRHLSLICILIAIWQTAALVVGYYLSVLLYYADIVNDEKFVGLVLATAIFFGLGVRLIVKAVKNERILEKREENLGIKRFLRMAAITSVYTILAGIAFGFLQTSLMAILVTIACCTVVVVVAGMYTGYHLGFVHKTKAYAGGAVLLWIAGIDVIVRHIL